VILDEDGKTITTDGRRCISEDPAGKDFPWRPKSTEELLGDVLDGKNGKVPVSSLKGKKIALYFSAHWCPPCRGFTPQLAEVYNNMKSSGKDDFEFIFVSSDRDEESFNEYFGEMPWLALPFANREEKQLLSAKYEVSGIPSLITLDENFKVINKSARGQAGADTKGENFPWYPAPVEELSATVESNGFDVNEKPALIAGLVGMGSAEQNEVEQDMIKVAKEYIAAADDEGPEFIFFTAKNSAGPVDQVFQNDGRQLIRISRLGHA